MKHRLGFVLSLASTVLAGCGGGGGGGAAPAPLPVQRCQVDSVIPPADATRKPRDLLALDHWMLILPVDANGTRTGTARTVEPPELRAGYASEWFFATTDGGVALRAPLDGARTPDTPFPRSELREVIDPADTDAAWRVGGAALLRARLAVNQVPPVDGTVVVGKIVGHVPGAAEYPSLLRLAFVVDAATCTGALTALVAEAPQRSAPSQALPIASGLRLNAPFAYSVEVNSGTLTVRSGAGQRSVAIDPRWGSTPVYFMAGTGLASNGTSALGAGVTIYEISATH